MSRTKVTPSSPSQDQAVQQKESGPVYRLVKLDERNWSIATDRKKENRSTYRPRWYFDRIEVALRTLSSKLSEIGKNVTRIEEVLGKAAGAKERLVAQSRVVAAHLESLERMK